jgi:hypothetical protein
VRLGCGGGGLNKLGFDLRLEAQLAAPGLVVGICQRGGVDRLPLPHLDRRRVCRLQGRRLRRATVHLPRQLRPARTVAPSALMAFTVKAEAVGTHLSFSACCSAARCLASAIASASRFSPVSACAACSCSTTCVCRDAARAVSATANASTAAARASAARRRPTSARASSVSTTAGSRRVATGDAAARVVPRGDACGTDCVAAASMCRTSNNGAKFSHRKPAAVGGQIYIHACIRIHHTR